MRRSIVQTITTLAVVAAALSVGCTTEKIVYRSGSNFVAPPGSAKSFVGYSDETSKQTVCGGCHVDAQSRWVTTKHASAWNTLSTSGSMQGYCQGCHTVGAYGNAATDTVAGTMPPPASAAMSNTMAKDEYDTTVNNAPTTMSSKMSLGKAASSWRTVTDSIKGLDAAPMSCNAKVMSPTPIITRPMRPAVFFS